MWEKEIYKNIGFIKGTALIDMLHKNGTILGEFYVKGVKYAKEGLFVPKSVIEECMKGIAW